jgi:hypothetical protein
MVLIFQELRANAVALQSVAALQSMTMVTVFMLC